MIGQTIVLLFIIFQLLLLIPLEATGNQVWTILFFKIPLHHEPILSTFYLLGINRVKVGFAQRQIVDRIQKVRLARPIRTSECIGMW